tara:strand:+ start:1016 stop:1561 length:546 start_codon:yes stop_codon:yes gene_type:complete
MVQNVVPNSDDTDGNWTDKDGGSTLYTSIDEVSADDATTYIKVTDTSSAEVCIVLLASPTLPLSSGSAFIKWKALTEDGTGMGAPTLKIELLQDSTQKATTPDTTISTSAWTSYSYEISDVSGISDWDALKLRITMIAGNGAGMGGSDVMKVTHAYLETQDAGSSSIAPLAMNTYKQMRGD